MIQHMSRDNHHKNKNRSEYQYLVEAFIEKASDGT